MWKAGEVEVGDQQGPACFAGGFLSWARLWGVRVVSAIVGFLFQPYFSLLRFRKNFLEILS